MNRFLLASVVMLTSVSLAQCQTAEIKSGGEQSVGVTAASSPTPEKKSAAGAFAEATYKSARGGEMSYLLFTPGDYDKAKSYPLVLWLHGGGQRGNDLKMLLAHGDAQGAGFLARSDTQEKYPAFVLAPQCPVGGRWGNPGASQPTAQMKLALEIVDKLTTEYSVDTSRLYVMGLSLGGYGTWDAIVRRPDMFAAAVPICGGGDVSRAASIKTAVWAFHGDEDESVNVSESRRMIAALKAAGSAPRYTEYKGVGHNSWEPAFAEPDLLAWMYAQKKSGK